MQKRVSANLRLLQENKSALNYTETMIQNLFHAQIALHNIGHAVFNSEVLIAYSARLCLGKSGGGRPSCGPELLVLYILVSK